MHHWMTVVFAANWGFAALMLAVGYTLGWLMRRRVEGIKREDAKVLRADGPRETVTLHDRLEAAATETLAPIRPVFKTQSGQMIESPRTWDQRLAKFGGPEQIPYEELEGMFLDQFLIRYFYSLMPDRLDNWSPSAGFVSTPWEAFIKQCTWAKEMPLLFEQMTGYKLNDIQLNNAIAEWARRLQKMPKPDAHFQVGQHVTVKRPGDSAPWDGVVSRVLSGHPGWFTVLGGSPYRDCQFNTDVEGQYISPRAETSVQRETETAG